MKREKPRTFSLQHQGERFLVISLPAEDDRFPGLTRTEQAIADAIALGASNAEIARTRRTSVRTVANQVASILRKLGVSSRTQIALKLGASNGAGQ
jgi:DNA-binding NarL/FixJ family response regulator